MDTAIVELIRALLKHSECIALFVLLVFQQLIMHGINIRKLNALYRQLQSVPKKLSPNEDDDATNGR